MFDLWGPGEAKQADEDLAILDTMLAGGPAAETALAGLAAEWQREHGEAFDAFDGRLAAPDIIEALCRRFPGRSSMSARRLDTFGGCPFAFFASEILGLAAVEEPSPDLAPLRIGTIYHELLERFFSAVAASKTLAGRLTAENRGAAEKLLGQTAQTYFANLEKFGRVGSPALWKVQKQNILRDVRGLVDWHVEKLASWRVAYTEVAFGATAGEPRPPGRTEPISIGTPHGEVRLRGRIDRIDLGTDDQAGCQVIDYKTGGGPSPKDMKEGTSFQLPIYLWAAGELLKSGDVGERQRAFFLPIRDPRLSAKLASHDSRGKPDPKFKAALDRARTYIARFIDAMRLGLYPVYPRSRCGAPCDFEGLCRYTEWRIARKWELHPIPQLDVIADEADDDEEADS
jgi:hypothetical protein